MSHRIVVPKGLVSVGQLHAELLQRVPAWRGTLGPDGVYIDPLLSVEWTGQEIRLTVPDASDEPTVRQVLAQHVPKPPKDFKKIRKDAEQKLKLLGFTDDELSFILK